MPYSINSLMKLEDIKKSVKHSVKVALERAIYDAASQIEESELTEFISRVIDGIYSVSDEDLPESTEE